MAGSQYIALSGMRTRLDQLDRLAGDIANVGTAGYKSQRAADAQADRPQFNAVLQSAIDVTTGDRRLDVSPGTMTGTGRDLDVALPGKGWFSVQAADGSEAYTRNGSLQISPNGLLQTRNGQAVMGDGGPIAIPADTLITIAGDGSTQQRVAISGHIYEGLIKQGANDDNSGCALTLEIGRAYIKLIKEGKLPRPKRTINFQWCFCDSACSAGNHCAACESPKSTTDVVDDVSPKAHVDHVVAPGGR